MHRNSHLTVRLQLQEYCALSCNMGKSYKGRCNLCGMLAQTMIS